MVSGQLNRLYYRISVKGALDFCNESRLLAETRSSANAQSVSTIDFSP